MTLEATCEFLPAKALVVDGSVTGTEKVGPVGDVTEYVGPRTAQQTEHAIGVPWGGGRAVLCSIYSALHKM
jgi:hypothetical protein